MFIDKKNKTGISLNFRVDVEKWEKTISKSNHYLHHNRFFRFLYIESFKILRHFGADPIHAIFYQ